MFGMDPTQRVPGTPFDAVNARQAMFPWAMGYGPPAAMDPADTVALTPMPTMPAMPADMTAGDMAAFFDKVRRMKQQAQEAALHQGGRPRPVDPSRPTGDTTTKSAGPLDVRAHAYYQGNQMVPVREVRIWEVNNYRNRTYNTFSGDWEAQDLRLPRTTLGKYYRVQVTWSDGVSEQRDVRMDNPDGQSFDFYHY